MATAAPRNNDFSILRAIAGGLALLALGVLASWSAATGSGAVAVGGVVALAIFYFVLRNPYVGVLVYVTTFLFTYPAALRGIGNLTINNVLGLILMPLMMYGTLRDGISWFTKVRPLVYLIFAGVIFASSGTFYNTTMVAEGRQAENLRRGVDRTLYAARRVEGALVATRAQGAKWFTRYIFLLFFVFFVRTPRQIYAVVALLIGILIFTYGSLTSQAGALGWGAGRLRVATGEAGTALYTGTNPNKLAFYATFCLALLWYMRLRVRSIFSFLPWFLLTVSSLVVIPLTGSRSGFINLLFFGSIVLFEGRFGFRQIVGGVMAATVAVVQFGYDVNILDLLLPEQVSERLQSLAPGEILEEGQTATGSFQRRARGFFTGVGTIRYHPTLGVGVGNYSALMNAARPTDPLGPMHNSYLTTALEGGFVVLILYLAGFWWVGKHLNDLMQDYDARFGPVDMYWLVNGCRTSFYLFMTFSMFADVWVHIYYHIVIGLCLCVIRCHHSYAETGFVPGTEPPPGDVLDGPATVGVRG